MSKNCVIVGAGDFSVDIFSPPEDSFIIAADGGYKHLLSYGITPDEIVGDFDSLGEVPDHPNVTKLPVHKDDTDIFSAVKSALKKGFDRFYIYGATGGKRFDHTVANFQILQYIANRNAAGFIVDKGFNAVAVKNSSLIFDSNFKGTISLFSLCEKAEGVKIKGLEYEIENATLSPDFPLGVSNSFKGEQAEISVKNGIITAIWYENRLPEII